MTDRTQTNQPQIPKNKAMPQPDSNRTHAGRTDLVCVRDCEIPELGSFKAGDIVTTHDAYVKLQDHPYFAFQDESEAK